MHFVAKIDISVDKCKNKDLEIMAASDSKTIGAPLQIELIVARGPSDWTLDTKNRVNRG